MAEKGRSVGEAQAGNMSHNGWTKIKPSMQKCSIAPKPRNSYLFLLFGSLPQVLLCTQSLQPSLLSPGSALARSLEAEPGARCQIQVLQHGLWTLN